MYGHRTVRLTRVILSKRGAAQARVGLTVGKPEDLVEFASSLSLPWRSDTTARPNRACKETLHRKGGRIPLEVRAVGRSCARLSQGDRRAVRFRECWVEAPQGLGRCGARRDPGVDFRRCGRRE
jgi:hypothetical protein